MLGDRVELLGGSAVCCVLCAAAVGYYAFLVLCDVCLSCFLCVAFALSTGGCWIKVQGPAVQKYEFAESVFLCSLDQGTSH